MRALVTGGTGFVGGAVARELLDRGHSVRAFARASSKTRALEAFGVEIARGDVLDRDSFTAALAGCDTLFHAAAIYEMYIPDREALMRTEIEGTRNAFEAALAAGVGNVVYTSTSACVGERRGETGNEQTAHRGYHLNDYEEAKYKAELVAREYAERIPTVTIRPAAVLGPGDLKPTGTSIVNFLNGKLPAIFHGVLTYVAINDVAAAHVLAAEQERRGETYCLAESVLTTGELFRMLADLSGRRRPLTVPAWIAGIYANYEEWKAGRTGKPPLMTKASYRLATHGFRVDGSRAARELGFTYTSVETTLREALEWYWTNGLLSKRPACV
jgi:dihydroflavonol-4-reductase